MMKDRREVGRRALFRSALLSLPGLPGAYSCGLRDMSYQGAGLRLQGLVLLPIDFSMLLRGSRSSIACRLIWRDGDYAGVKFLSVD
jgi:hypothetical protein